MDRIRLWINTNLRMDLDEPGATLVGEQAWLRRSSLTAEQLSCLPIMEVAAILFESEAPAPANDAAPKTTVVGMTWQESAERLERLRGQGEPFTSQAKLAEQRPVFSHDQQSDQEHTVAEDVGEANHVNCSQGPEPQ